MDWAKVGKIASWLFGGIGGGILLLIVTLALTGDDSDPPRPPPEPPATAPTGDGSTGPTGATGPDDVVQGGTPNCPDNQASGAAAGGDPYEQNQRFTDAYGPLRPRKIYEGKRATANDTEFFFLCNPVRQEIEVIFANPKERNGFGCTNLLIDLLNENANSLPSDVSGRPDPGKQSVLRHTAKPGLYYIQIHDLLSERCPWTLRVEAPEGLLR